LSSLLSTIGHVEEHAMLDDAVDPEQAIAASKNRLL